MTNYERHNYQYEGIEGLVKGRKSTDLGQGHPCVEMPPARHMKGLISPINVLPSS